MKKESDVLEEVSRKTSVPVTAVRAVVDVLRDEARNGNDVLLHGSDSRASRFELQSPGSIDPKLVDELIARAEKHRLGIEFLLDGYLGSVAAEFGAHAFTVEAARAKLRNAKRADS